ncbi:MAG: SUMF1/EgtB/PvdO family nonheme iron enzyme [Thiothrix litoralis]|uniref:nSTAND1 domain-containing NTPase n=1 Tax=Thiothrix litoralis TaxID=2891210 RepID=UPI003C76608D
MSTTPPTAQIFLSYSRTNLDAAIMLRSELEKAGFKVFRDEDDIRVGDKWMERLQTALQDCSAFVLLYGREGVRRWVGAEVQYALGRNLSPHDDTLRLPIFPILLPEGDLHSLPPFLSLFQIQRWAAGDALPEKLIHAIRDKTELLDDRNTFTGCPYLGLGAFQQQDAKLFFGRRKETLEALKFLGTQRDSNPANIHIDAQYCRWLQIEGNSGAGKSSLVNAGMLPLIQQGALWARTGYEKWQIIGPMMPGKQPLKQLAEALEHALEPDPTRRDSLGLQQRMEADERVLAYRLGDRKQANTAFLLVVDQFEELFTFAEETEKRQFDAQLAYALADSTCPLFLISTVRIDFLDGFERLGKLSERYNDQCKRYLLKTLSQDGIREVIEQPARLAGLDVSEITSAILSDTENEPGALPLVENALYYLWKHRKGNRLSYELYRSQGKLIGLLGKQADALLERLDKEKDLPKGREGALELLLHLTRINPQGNHTRERIPLLKARQIAGEEDEARGQKIIDYLAGKRVEGGNGSLRLITTVGEKKDDEAGTWDVTTGAYREPKYEGKYVDLIHETLIRARPVDKTDKGGKLVGYWQTLYSYIDKNRDRLFYRDQLKEQAETWQASRWFGRWWHLAGWRDIKHYRKVRPGKATLEGRFLRQSERMAWLQGGVMALLLAFVGQSYLWTLDNSLPPSYMLTLQKFRLMNWGWLDEPLPEMVEKEIQPPAGEFRVGEYDKDFGEMANAQLQKSGNYAQQNFGYPTTNATISQPFFIGKYEVSYEQYDYYVWQQQSTQKDLKYPNGEPSQNQRGQRAVTYVSWNDANAYLQWLGTKTEGKYQYRLPTEAEWEYVARAGTDTPYWWGDRDAAEGKANCDGCDKQWGGKYVAPIGSFAPNTFGLYDTAGNVWEWTCSEWKADFDGNEGRCVEPKNEAGIRVLRGGSWSNAAEWLRSSARFRLNTDFRNFDVGFRVLRSARTN